MGLSDFQKMFSNKEITKAMNKAHKEAGHNAYFGEGFKMGIDFALDKIEKTLLKMKDNKKVCD